MIKHNWERGRTTSDAARWWHVAIPIAGVFLLALFAVLYHRFPDTYFRILIAWGTHPFRFPFLDTHAVLSALQCARQGFNTYVDNPCDVLTRTFVYSPIILDGAIFPVTTTWNNWVGVLLALIFFLCVGSLPAPHGAREWATMILATFSTMSVYALERGNLDIVVFLLMTLAGHLACRSFVARSFGYLIVFFGAVLKYYPIVAFVIVFRETPRRFALVVASLLSALILFLVSYRHGLSEAIGHLPAGSSYFTDLFGASNLPYGLTELLKPVIFSSGGNPILRFLPWLLMSGLAANCLREAIIVARRTDTRTRIAALPAPHSVFLAIGTAVLVACFFASQNVNYRGIFFLLVLPGLSVMGATEGGGIFGRTAIAIVFLTWGEFFSQGFDILGNELAISPVVARFVENCFWLVRELVWWWVIGILAGLLASLMMNSKLGLSSVLLSRNILGMATPESE